MEEVWKPVVGFDNYFVSSLGQVKSTKYKESRILKPSFVDRKNGKKLYAKVCLCKQDKVYTKTIHTIMAESFYNYTYNKEDNKVIDHIDNNSLNNNINNLQIISNRYNLSKDNKFPGAHWHKRDKVWESSIYFNKITVYLGKFNSQQEASNAYVDAFTKIENNEFDINFYKNEKIKISKST
jgi:hypothetical protein